MIKSTKIWRVQNEFGYGPFNGKGNIQSFLQAHVKHAKLKKGQCPTPWNDKLLSKVFTHYSDFLRSPHLRSGFNSLSQYQDWFSADFLRQALDATGFFLVQYTVPEKDRLLGDKQVIFVLDNASITNFSRCNEIVELMKASNIQHIPMQRFLENNTIPVELDGI